MIGSSKHGRDPDRLGRIEQHLRQLAGVVPRLSPGATARTPQ